MADSGRDYHYQMMTKNQCYYLTVLTFAQLTVPEPAGTLAAQPSPRSRAADALAQTREGRQACGGRSRPPAHAAASAGSVRPAIPQRSVACSCLRPVVSVCVLYSYATAAGRRPREYELAPASAAALLPSPLSLTGSDKVSSRLSYASYPDDTRTTRHRPATPGAARRYANRLRTLQPLNARSKREASPLYR